MLVPVAVQEGEGTSAVLSDAEPPERIDGEGEPAPPAAAIPLPAPAPAAAPPPGTFPASASVTVGVSNLASTSPRRFMVGSTMKSIKPVGEVAELRML